MKFLDELAMVPEFREMGANVANEACLPFEIRSSSGGSHLWEVRPTPTVLLRNQASLPGR